MNGWGLILIRSRCGRGGNIAKRDGDLAIFLWAI